MLNLNVIFSFSLIVIYLILPETEHRSLADIELHFSDDTKKLTDIYIPIAGKRTDNDSFEDVPL